MGLHNWRSTMSDPVAEAAAQLAEQAEQTQEGADLGNAPAVAEASVTAPATAEVVELPNGPTSAGVDTDAVAHVEGESPNVASGAAEPTTEPDSAPSADGANTTSPIDGSSGEPEATDSRPLHMRVAAHLEAIFQMVKTDTQRAPTAAESHAEHVKSHIGDVLHRISNGMAVAEGEMVQKLEALYRML
jgi:hypothetical protein